VNSGYHKSPKAHLVPFAFKKRHGMSLTPTYFNWKGMIARCHCPTHKDYPKYGGRGIKVCERWRTWENFYADMGERPLGKSIERIDNDGPYSLENCRWATPTEQNRNKRSNVRYHFMGRDLTISEWCELTGIPRPRLRARLSTYKWPIARALSP